jgi:hypothetical protein
MIIILPENEKEHGAALWRRWDKNPKILVLPYRMSSFQGEGGAAVFGRVRFHVKDKLSKKA